MNVLILSIMLLALPGIVCWGYLICIEEPPFWLEQLKAKARAKALKRFKQDRPVVGYDLLELVDGKFELVATSSKSDPFSTDSLFVYQDKSEALKKASSFKRQFLAEVLLYGEVKDNAHTYRSTDHRVLQIVSLGEPIRGIFNRSKPIEDLQPLVDRLQEEAGVVQPIRYVQSLDDFEPTVIEKSRRTIAREYALRDYFASVKSFYADDDLTVAPGLLPVSAKKKAPALKRSKRSKATTIGTLIEELQLRISETSGRNIQNTLKVLLGELTELNGKLTESVVSQGARVMDAKYGPAVRKLIDLSSSDYYGSFRRNPDRWSDPERMAVQVELAAVTLTRELTKGLRALNSPRELDFQVGVLSLVGRDTTSKNAPYDAPKIKELLNSSTDQVDFSGDLESLRAAVELEEAELLQQQKRPKSIREALLG